MSPEASQVAGQSFCGHEATLPLAQDTCCSFRDCSFPSVRSLENWLSRADQALRYGPLQDFHYPHQETEAQLGGSCQLISGHVDPYEVHSSEEQLCISEGRKEADSLAFSLFFSREKDLNLLTMITES